MNIKEIALKVLRDEFPGMRQENQTFMIEFAEALVAEVQRQGKRDAVPEGWCFYHADFSLQAAGKSKVGTVTFIRDAVGREWWHSLPEEQQEETPLYIYGKGRTVMEAIAAAPKQEK